MFCSKCGAMLGEKEKFCHKCGEPVYKKDSHIVVESNRNSGLYNDSVKRGKKLPLKRPYLFLAAVVCVVFIILGIRFVGNGDYKTPIKLVVEGVEKQDVQKVMSAVFPKEVEKQRGIDMDGVVDLIEDYVLDKYNEEFGDAAGVSIDYQIKEKKSCTKEEIEEIEEDYNDTFRTDIKIKDAKKLVVKTKVSANGEESTEDITVVKIGKKWYINLVDLI